MVSWISGIQSLLIRNLKDTKNTMSRSRILATCLALLLAISCSAQVVTTFAGGPWIFPGGGGLAVSAPLGLLNGIAIDSGLLLR
jgi:hypothetical protein